MKLAAASYPIDRIWGYLGLVEKYDAWVRAAAREGAELLVFPEYGAMELATLAGEDVAGDLAGSMQAVSDRLPDYWEMLEELARRHGVCILAGSGPLRRNGVWINRAMFLTPSGARQPHDKQIPTPWERDRMAVGPGDPLTLMQTPLGRVGVLICYDAEFPLLARALVEAGAEVLLVPSQTEAETGYNRVRIGAMARALEGQCVTVQAVTQGDAPWSALLDRNAGAAGIFAPPDAGLPATGVVAQGRFGEAGWVFGSVDLEALARARASGEVRTRDHWSETPGRARGVQTVALA